MAGASAPSASSGAAQCPLLLVAVRWSVGRGGRSPQRRSRTWGGASDPPRSKIGGGASDSPKQFDLWGASDPLSSLICGVLVIPKQIFWRGLLWFPAFRC